MAGREKSANGKDSSLPEVRGTLYSLFKIENGSSKRLLSRREILAILCSFLNYLSIWGLFVAAEIAAWLAKGHCHIAHFSDGTYYIDCVCYQPGYQGKC